MKFLFPFFLGFVLIIWVQQCKAKCKFGEIKFKEENDKEEVLKHYLSHKVSLSNIWSNFMRGRYLDPVTSLLTTDKQSLCECVYDKLSGEDSEEHTLEEVHARYSQRTLYEIGDKNGAGILKFEFMVRCKVDQETFFLSQGYQSYEKVNDHDVYVFAPYEKTSLMQFKGLVEKLDFSNIDKHSVYKKLLYHFQNADSPHKHE